MAQPPLARYTPAMNLKRSFFALVVTCIATSALAQWQWIDKDGHKVFSDRAPPADVADKNILRRPAGRMPSTPAPVADTPPADATATGTATTLPAPAAKGAGVDKELEAKKKQAAEAEAAKKKADDERITKAKIENCARAKQAKATFDSGVRVARTNAAGEREVMDDAARDAETKRIQSIIDRDCK